MADSDSDSDSYSSDDDYLTSVGHQRDPSSMGGGIGGIHSMSAEEEREAIIRRKLMESFYGSSAPPPPTSKSSYNNSSSGPKNPNTDTSHNKTNKKGEEKHAEPISNMATSHLSSHTNQTNPKITSTAQESKTDNFDLDSSTFSSYNYTRSLLLSCNTETLLKNDESLSTNIRTLDSTMQTLVYENYSKFIDATDAVRSINQSVDHSAENGLQKLSDSMERIEVLSTQFNNDVCTLRKAVAEKLEIKQHLERLEHLLNLPTTLKDCVSKGKYRLAAKRHNQAAMILAKHSDGFESLIKIEGECKIIMENMLQDLIWKLLVWSGRARMISGRNHDTITDITSEETGSLSETQEMIEHHYDNSHRDHPPLPETVAEIFECAGTFDILSLHQSTTLLKSEASNFTSDKCKPLALDAVQKLLERTLDNHRLKIDGAENDYWDYDESDVDATLSSWGTDALQRNKDNNGRRRMFTDHQKQSWTQGIGETIVPTEFLDKMLEACTLFGITFSQSTDDDQNLLNTFVSQLFSTFLTYVKMDLLDLNIIQNESVDNATNKTTKANQENKDGFTEIATALTHLLRSTRELASGLALPEVGVDMRIASGLVEQTMELTEHMIRRYVSLRFYTLRTQAVKECVTHFVKEAVEYSTSKDTSLSVVDVVRMVSVAVAEMMQLADSNIEDVTAILSSAPVEDTMVRLSIQKNSCRFALWLASIFEMLAGCDTIIVSGNDKKKLLQVRNEDDEFDDTTTSKDMLSSDIITGVDVPTFDMDEDENESDDPLYSLVEQLEDTFSLEPTFRAHITLALAQACRMAEKSVIETINTSISSSMNSDKNEKDVRSRFGHNKQGVDVDADGFISKRFQTASTRILALYATDQGTVAATVACSDIVSDYVNTNQLKRLPTGPRKCMCEILEIAKATSIDCATIFGGSSMAAPFQPFEDEDNTFQPYRNHPSLGLGGAMVGFQLDVERMFAQKTIIFKESTDFDRDSVLCGILMIAFKAIIEKVRVCAFTSKGYRQMRVDVELLRHMVPHYVKSELLGSLNNLLDDVMMNMRSRCIDKDIVDDGSEFYDSSGRMFLPTSIVREFMDKNIDLTAKFVIADASE